MSQMPGDLTFRVQLMGAKHMMNLAIGSTVAAVLLLATALTAHAQILNDSAAVAKSISATESIAAKAGWTRCDYWRHTCAWRWGPEGWRYRRCLWRHAC
jgi:hypothetical protein